MGQVPMAAAQDRLFPPLFSQLSPQGVPAIGIVISAIFATLLVLSQVAGPPGFSAVYNLVVGLSTMAAVIPYAFCALATGLVAAYAAGGGPVPRLTIDRGDRVHFCCFHALRMRRRTRTLWLDNAGAGHPRLRLAATSHLTRAGVCALSPSTDHVPCGFTVRFELVSYDVIVDKFKPKAGPMQVGIVDGDKREI